MFQLFSGTSHPSLTDEIGKILQIPIAKSEVVRFENSEIRVRINEDVKHNAVVLVQSTSNPTDTHLMELFFFSDALHRQEANKVIAVIPYFGYARQDIQHRSGECVSANVIIRFLESIGLHKVYTINLHDEATEGVFSIPFKNIDAFPVLAQEIKKYLTKDFSDLNTSVRVVSPDQGGVERARKFSDYLLGHDNHTIAVVEKKRDLDHIHQSQALDLYGDVKGRTAIIVDDLVTSGGTLIHASQLCIEKGAKRVIAAVVHHDFGTKSSLSIEASVIEKLFTTNSIMLQENQNFSKLQEVSVAGLIAEELKYLM